MLEKADAFDEMLTKLQNAFTRAWDKQAKDAIAAALDRLRTLGPGKFSVKDADMIERVLEDRIGPEAMKSAVNGPVMALTEPLWMLGAVEGAGMDIQFGLADLDSLAVLERGNLFWTGQHWNSFTHEKFQAALKEYFESGLTREALAARMAEDFGHLRKRGAHYWNLLADHTATKTREIGRVTGYERARIEEVVVRARMDDRTTRICRALHDKVISVRVLREQANRYLKAVGEMNPGEAKKVWPMMGDKEAEKIEAGMVPANVGSPPYHFRCRTITVVRFRDTEVTP